MDTEQYLQLIAGGHQQYPPCGRVVDVVKRDFLKKGSVHIT